jgi:hypothetical protein
MTHFDLTAQIGESTDETMNRLGLVATVEVGGTELLVHDAVTEHVVTGGQYRGGDSEGWPSWRLAGT